MDQQESETAATICVSIFVDVSWKKCSIFLSTPIPPSPNFPRFCPFAKGNAAFSIRMMRFSIFPRLLSPFVESREFRGRWRKKNDRNGNAVEFPPPTQMSMNKFGWSEHENKKSVSHSGRVFAERQRWMHRPWPSLP